MTFDLLLACAAWYLGALWLSYLAQKLGLYPERNA